MMHRRLTDICKSCYSNVADWSGVNAASRDLHRKSVVVLSYHGVISNHYADHPLRTSNMVTVSEFQWHLEEIVRLFHPISASDLRAWLRDTSELPDRAVLVTFDDGYANNLTYAVPLLRRAGVPAVFFIPTGYMQQRRLLWPTEVFCRCFYWPAQRMPLPRGAMAEVPRDHAARRKFALEIEEACKRLPTILCEGYLTRLRTADTLPLDGSTEELFGFLDWGGVRELRRNGFDVGSHTVNHPILSRISQPQLTHELHASKAAVEQETAADCFCFAYPNGGAEDITPEAIRAVADAGYELAFSLMGGFCRRDANPMLLDRIWIPGRIGIREFRTRTSGIHGGLKQLLQMTSSRHRSSGLKRNAA